MSTAQLRRRYARDSLTTASPARPVTMLHDRLARDLAPAGDLALGGPGIPVARHALRHARDIVSKLAGGPRPKWAGGRPLANLHPLFMQLVAANVHEDGALASGSMRAARHEAAAASGASS